MMIAKNNGRINSSWQIRTLGIIGSKHCNHCLLKQLLPTNINVQN